MGRGSKIFIIFTSIGVGALTAYAIASTLYRNELDSTMGWVSTIALLTLGFGGTIFMILPKAWDGFSKVPLRIKLWGAALAFVSALCFSFSIGILFLIPLFLFGLIVTSLTISSLQEMDFPYFVTAWAIAGLMSFFGVGFLKNFHPSFLEFFFITLILNFSLTWILENLIKEVAQSLKAETIKKLVSITPLAVGFVLLFLVLGVVKQYPKVFSSGFFLPVLQTIPVFLGLTILSQGITAFLIRQTNPYNWQKSTFVSWIKRNLPGLVLAGTIAISTYILATALVSPDLRYMDIYFHSDSPFWVNFLTETANEMIIMRAVHPFVLLILRPPVWLISLFLKGDTFQATLILNSIGGGACIFLTWLFFKKRTGKTTFALLIAALLGISTSHLVFSAFLESYIFSALALISFIVLLQYKEDSLPHSVFAGLLTFGITITNFIQTCVAFFLVRRDIKSIFKYVTIVLMFAVLLAFVQHMFYPTSDPFYITKNFKAESVYRYDYLDIPRAEGLRIFKSRVNVTFRNTALFSIVAPRLIVYTDDVSCFLPCFRIMRFFRGEFRYASYIGFGSFLVRTWFLLLVAAGVLFVWKFFKSPKETMLQLALVVNILFNFVLHVNYGDDLLLYSANWTYALVFFFGMSFERFSDKKWFQIPLLVFIVAIIFNNIELFHTILGAIVPYR
jgi:hypothetical protein